MKKIIHTAIAFVLLVSIVLSSTSCWLFPEPAYPYEEEKDGVEYFYRSRINGYAINSIFDRDNPAEVTTIYVLDYLNGAPVLWSGNNVSISDPSLNLLVSTTQRIYFPWTIIYYADLYYREGLRAAEFFVSSANRALIDYIPYVSSPTKLVITKWLYDNADEKQRRYMNKYNDYYIPANISYMFNHEGQPNEGYFFVDLLEESGKPTKPPYDPQREGFTFLGWYKDEACTEEWDFEQDEVEILFDEEGNRIYEEIKLYAKWEEIEGYGDDLIYPENISFLLNYDGAPNDGYFYSMEKTSGGIIQEPPTAPVRIGYFFEGWYKDEACTEAWNFEKDKVEILFDEEGNCIYEEIKFYAKWLGRIAI